jgi:hypothetical protein
MALARRGLLSLRVHRVAGRSGNSSLRTTETSWGAEMPSLTPLRLIAVTRMQMLPPITTSSDLRRLRTSIVCLLAEFSCRFALKEPLSGIRRGIAHRQSARTYGLASGTFITIGKHCARRRRSSPSRQKVLSCPCLTKTAAMRPPHQSRAASPTTARFWPRWRTNGPWHSPRRGPVSSCSGPR